MQSEADLYGDEELEKLNKMESLKRSQLQNKNEFSQKSFNRHFKNVKKRYLLFPEEIKRQVELKNIFKNFDDDNSNALDQGEMFDMFQKYGIKIRETQLRQFFREVDEDKDSIYYSCSQSSRVQKQCFQLKSQLKQTSSFFTIYEVFTNIMRQLREEAENENKIEEKKEEEEDDAEPLPFFIPMSFDDMVSYLSFCTSREGLIESLGEENLSSLEKLKKFQEIFKLTGQYQIKKKKQIVLEKKEKSKQKQNLSEEKQLVGNLSRQLNSNIKQLENVSTEAKILRDKKKPRSTIQKSTHQEKVPHNLKNIDYTMKYHMNQSQINKDQYFFDNPFHRKNNSKTKKMEEKISTLKSEVDNYVQLARNKYGIDIPEFMTTQHKPIQITLNNMEDDMKDTLSSQSQIYQKVLSNSTIKPIKQLPKIEESAQETHRKNKIYNSCGQSEYLPVDLLHKLRKFQKTAECKTSMQKTFTEGTFTPQTKMLRTTQNKFNRNVISQQQFRVSGLERTGSQQFSQKPKSMLQSRNWFKQKKHSFSSMSNQMIQGTKIDI